MSFNPFEQRLKQNQNPQQVSQPKKFNPFEKRAKEREEGFFKSSARTALQVPLGITKRLTYPLDLVSMMGIGEALDPEEIENIKRVSEREGIPFDEEKYMQAVQNAAETFPTQENIIRGIENKTGLPLQAKTPLQKGVNFFSSAGAFTPGTFSQKLAGGGIATAGKEGLKELGIPEPLAEFGGFGLGIGLGGKTPPISANISKAKKPSGLTERRFENIKEPKNVSSKTIDKINTKVEGDFRDLSNKIIKDSPIGETAKELNNNPKYRQESRELLDEAQNIADRIPGTVATQGLKDEMVKLANKNIKGISLSEYDKNYIKYINEEMKGIEKGEMSHGEMVQQYRKNNESLREYFEPGSSKAQNRAKRDSILEYNRAISEVMEKSDPELSKVFKEGNARWTKIMDVEAVDDFISEVFGSEKINYKKARDFFDKSGQARVFKRALGEDGFKKFDQLMQDLLESEAPYGMLKIAKGKGFQDLFETAGAFILNQKLGKAKLAWDTTKRTYKAFVNMLLDKPKLVFKFDKAMTDLKKGKFSEAQKEFEGLKGEILEAEKATAIKKKEGETIEVQNKRLGEPPKGIEVPSNKRFEPSSKGGQTFETEKGSIYKVNEDGTTTRNKAYRPEHGAKEQGLQPNSEKTFYASKDAVDKLSLFQTQGVGDKKLFFYPDGKVGVMYTSGPHKGKVAASSVAEVSETPAKGLTPIETWDNGEKVHFGNKITKMIEAQKEKPKPAKAKPPKPKVEKNEKITNKLPQQGSVHWFIGQKKRPFAKSTPGVKGVIEAMIEPGDTFNDLLKKIHYGEEEKAIVQHFIDEGYGDFVIPLTKGGDIAALPELPKKQSTKLKNLK